MSDTTIDSLIDSANELIRLADERKVILSRLEKIIEGENK
jgi:hypothetical protein